MTTILERHFDVVTLHDKPVVQLEKSSPKPVKPIQEIVQQWMKEFNVAITARNSNAIAELFQENGISTTSMIHYYFFSSRSYKDGGVMF